MYFLSGEERQELLKGLLPKARELDIADDLRGWNWHRPPLAPIYEQRLGVFEVAGRYCPTGRDLYLRRVQGMRVKPSLAMVRGGYLHRALTETLVRAKRLIYVHGPNGVAEIEAALAEPINAAPPKDVGLSAEELTQLMGQGAVLHRFEVGRIVARLHDTLMRQPRIGVDSLAAQVVPVTVEQRLDGHFLGLSAHLSADACTIAEPLVLDVKFGRREKFHRLGTTGYALVMESVYEYPINLGCVVYADIQNGRVVVEKDFHIIDDELRQWFIEERDEKGRMLNDERDPGLPEVCPLDCPFYQVCH